MKSNIGVTSQITGSNRVITNCSDRLFNIAKAMENALVERELREELSDISYLIRSECGTINDMIEFLEEEDKETK